MTVFSILATFAMEISVELDKKTGKSQVVSTAHVTPETINERGLKVYDDGRKSIYAFHPDGGKTHGGALTPRDVEELLRQASDKSVPTGVQYHQPVYSVPYSGSSRPSTPGMPNITSRQTPTPTHSPFQSRLSPRGAQPLQEENQHSQDLVGRKAQRETLSLSLTQQHSMTGVPITGETTKLPHILEQSTSNSHNIPQPQVDTKTPQELSNSEVDVSSLSPAALVSVKAKSEGMPTPVQPIESSGDFYRRSPFWSESLVSLDNLPEETCPSEPVTMIFMGYENAEDNEEDDVQAELVIIANGDDEDEDDDEAHDARSESDGEEHLSFHPEGYKSKVFQPKVGVAKLTGCRDKLKNWDNLGPHKPTFIHKPGKHSP